MEKKKVGIITFHRSINYGAVLQCYALQEALQQEGYDVNVIDYRPDFKKRSNSIICTNPILNWLRKQYVAAREYSPKWIRWRLTFDGFCKRKLNLSEKCRYKNLPDNYDYYVIGSDQLWNKKITGEYHNAFFADFPFEKKGRKYISYAVSMEALFTDEEETLKLKELLKNFDVISVREKSAQKFLSSVSDKDIIRVSDPVLLHDSHFWTDFAVEKYTKGKYVLLYQSKYVLLYQIRYCQEAINIARDIARQIGAEVIELAANLNYPRENETISVQRPEIFVGMIKNAECVITTSFHGLVFSTLFHKPFYLIDMRDGWDNRTTELANTFGLQDRIIISSDRPGFSIPSFDYAEEQIAKMRRDAREFINTSLQ